MPCMFPSKRFFFCTKLLFIQGLKWFPNLQCVLIFISVLPSLSSMSRSFRNTFLKQGFPMRLSKKTLAYKKEDISRRNWPRKLHNGCSNFQIGAFRNTGLLTIPSFVRETGECAPNFIDLSTLDFPFIAIILNRL